MPPKKCGVITRYPFADMKVGDSFFVKGGLKETYNLRTAASYFAIRHPGYKFSVRAVDGGCRVWRVPMEPTEYGEPGTQPDPK